MGDCVTSFSSLHGPRSGARQRPLSREQTGLALLRTGKSNTEQGSMLRVSNCWLISSSVEPFGRRQTWGGTPKVVQVHVVVILSALPPYAFPNCIPHTYILHAHLHALEPTPKHAGLHPISFSSSRAIATSPFLLPLSFVSGSQEPRPLPENCARSSTAYACSKQPVWH